MTTGVFYDSNSNSLGGDFDSILVTSIVAGTVTVTGDIIHQGDVDIEGILKVDTVIGFTDASTLSLLGSDITDTNTSLVALMNQDPSTTADSDFNSMTLVVPLDEASGGTGFAGVYSNGQLLIGNTATGDLVVNTLTGVVNQIIITNGNGSIIISLPQDIASISSPTFASLTLTSPLATTEGGTGVTSYIDGQILIGNSFGGGLVKNTIAGTVNQISITNGSGTILLSLPQDIATGSAPTFENVTLDFMRLKDGPGDNVMIFSVDGDMTGDQILNFPPLTSSDTVCTLDFTQTLTNKTLTAPVIDGTDDILITIADATDIKSMLMPIDGSKTYGIEGFAGYGLYHGSFAKNRYLIGFGVREGPATNSTALYMPLYGRDSSGGSWTYHLQEIAWNEDTLRLNGAMDTRYGFSALGISTGITSGFSNRILHRFLNDTTVFMQYNPGGTVEFPDNGIMTNNIAESTSGAGVTVDINTLIKDGEITTLSITSPDGTDLTITGGTTGRVFVNDDLLVSNILENSLDLGVTIDSVLMKDQSVFANSYTALGFVITDNIVELTPGHGINIDSANITDTTLKIDAITSVTTGLAITPGSGDFTVDTTSGGAISLDSTHASSNFTLTTNADAQDLTIALIGANNSSIIIDSAGTGADAIRLNSAGGIDVDANGSEIISFNTTSGAADAFKFSCGTTAGFDIDLGSSGFDLDTTGDISLATSAASGSAIILDSSAAGGVTISSGSFGILMTAAFGGLVNIGNDTGTGNINLGTGATERTVTIGNTTLASAVNINSGTGNITLSPTSPGLVNIDDVKVKDGSVHLLEKASQDTPSSGYGAVYINNSFTSPIMEWVDDAGGIHGSGGVFGSMAVDESSIATVINVANVEQCFTSVDTVAGSSLRNVSFIAGGVFTFTGGTNIGGGIYQLTGLVGFTGVVGDIMSVATSGSSYNGVYSIFAATSTTVNISHADSGSESGDIQLGDQLKVEVPGDYNVNMNTGCSSATANTSYHYSLNVTSLDIGEVSNTRKFGVANDFGSIGFGGIIPFAADDRISMTITNQTNAANITVEHLNLNLARTG